MAFQIIRQLTVRREFRAGDEEGSLDVRRDCGLGCSCEGTYVRATPTAQQAERKTLCFNDRKKEGISEIPNTAKLIEEKDGVTVYEVQANDVD